MRLQTMRAQKRASRSWSPDIMKDELADALHEALHELAALPRHPDAALIGLYAVMDDLRNAIARTEALDLPHRSN
jgi:hypothetical protein